MTSAPVIQSGSVVTMHYSLSLRDGEMVDSSRGTGPVTIEIGKGDWADFLERPLLGLGIGDKRHVELSAQDTALERNETDIQHLHRADFPAELVLEAGRVFAFSLPSGEEIAGQVVSVEGDDVAVDFSHPLAGRDLELDVEILAIK